MGPSEKTPKSLQWEDTFTNLFLEPSKAEEWDFIDVASRNTKKYKEYVAELQANSSRPRDFALLQREKEKLSDGLMQSRRTFDFFNYIYDDKNAYEVPAVAEICGEQWKGKADIVGKDFLFDLKTTSNINDFRWNFRKYNYDSQAYIYSTLFNKPMVFLVIDKTSLMMGAYTVSEESLGRGKRKWREQ